MRLRWQVRSGLLRDHVRGVPVWPVWICCADALFVLAVGGRRAAKGAGQIGCGGEGGSGRGDASGGPSGDLLQEPAVAGGIAEGRERAVALMLGIRTADAEAAKEEGFVGAGVQGTG